MYTLFLSYDPRTNIQYEISFILQHCSLLFMLFETFPWTPICKVLTLIVTCVVLQVLWKRRNTGKHIYLFFYLPVPFLFLFYRFLSPDFTSRSTCGYHLNFQIKCMSVAFWCYFSFGFVCAIRFVYFAFSV